MDGMGKHAYASLHSLWKTQQTQIRQTVVHCHSWSVHNYCMQAWIVYAAVIVFISITFVHFECVLTTVKNMAGLQSTGSRDIHVHILTWKPVQPWIQTCCVVLSVALASMLLAHTLFPYFVYQWSVTIHYLFLKKCYFLSTKGVKSVLWIPKVSVY